MLTAQAISVVAGFGIAAADEVVSAEPSAEDRVTTEASDNSTEPAVAATPALDEVVVWGEQKDSEQAGYTSPVSTLTADDMKSINMATTEDSVKYEPGVVIRRRFIGDSNGTIGMRGSHMFQTARAMVFADGVPLHYLLRGRWNGAPRWTMVSASEIAQVDVIYGPFSAEYSGNAMGGVVNIETKIPQKREFHVDGMLFSHDFSAYGYDDTLNGYKGFMSYGDRIGKLSTYFSYNHMHNEAQPQTFRDSGQLTANGTEVPGSGGIVDNDSRGRQRVFYGDTGVVDTVTDNFKVKLGYDFGNWFGLLNLAYENRFSENTGNTYVTDASGNPIWSGRVVENGINYSVSSGRINARELERDSLNLGLRMKGDLGDASNLEINVSAFDLMRDESKSSSANPADPAFDGSGQVTDFSGSGWRTAEAKWTLDELGPEGMSLATGIRHEDYELSINVYGSGSYTAGSKDTLVDTSGGKTRLDAAFAQLIWAMNETWDTTLGLRYESWSSEDGYYMGATGVETVPSRSASRMSPKFSVGMKPASDWVVRYSLARAYRFPIVEELYSQYAAYNAVSIANPELKPEDGIHHNIMVERGLTRGYVRMNLFRDNISNVIESQTDPATSVRTFVPIDKVETTGADFVVNARKLFVDPLDIRFNLTWMDSKIVKNDPNPSLAGNTMPRSPEWRGNMLATWNISEAWNIGGSIQYAADSFGRLDNTDEEDNVYGAQDAYTFYGLKTTYRFPMGARVSLGVDNLTDELAYVAHPWPRRTVYLSASCDM